jgi:hypothetical protein
VLVDFYQKELNIRKNHKGHNMTLKAKALTETTQDLPEAKIIIEFKEGTLVKSSGFIVRKLIDGDVAIIIKAHVASKEQ